MLLLPLFLGGLALSSNSCRPVGVPPPGPAGQRTAGPSTGITPSPPGTSASWKPANPTGGFLNWLNRVNNYRQSIGVSQLAWHNGLASVAKVHTQDMIDDNYLSIVAPEGYDVFQMLVGANPPISFSNAYATVYTCPVSWGSGQAFNSLLKDPGFKAAVSDPRWTHFGLGSIWSNGTSYFTMFLGQNVAP